MNMIKSKRSQITLYIIIAIVLVSVILIAFYPRIKTRFAPSTPSVQLEGCIEDKLDEAVEMAENRGGSIKPVNSIMYEDEKVEYLCYTNQYYQTCTMQQPLLKQHIEREVLDYVLAEAKDCVNNLKNDLRKRGYYVSDEKQDIDVEIVPENVKVEVSGFSAVKEDAGERYDKFEVNKKSKIYDLIMLATSILNWEARYGDSDITNYMIYYPNIKVEKFKQGDGSKIYKLTDMREEEKFVFATRSLSWPPGYGFGEAYVPK